MEVTIDCCWDAIPIQKALDLDPNADLKSLYSEDVHMILTHWRQLKWRFEVILLAIIEDGDDWYHKEVKLECSLLEPMTLLHGCGELDKIIREQCQIEYNGVEPYALIIKAIGKLYVQSPFSNPTSSSRPATSIGRKTARKTKKCR